MNERIRELELEAIAYADSKVPADNRYNDIYHSIVRGKFAELIVRECAKQAYREELTVEEGMMRYRCILEHFGVEE